MTFGAGDTGTLSLGLAQSFAGTVAGLATGDAIDLTNFQFAGAPKVSTVTAITQNGKTIGEAVTVKDNTLTATIDLLNQAGIVYSSSASAYTLTKDTTSGHAGTLLELAAAH